MAVNVLSIALELFKTLSEAKERWDQRKQNVRLSGELQRFVQELQENMEELQMKAAGTCSNTSSCALSALGEDLKRANLDAKDILQKGFIRSIWDAKTTLSKMQALRERVMTSFQTRILFTTLDVAIKGQKGMDAFKTAMLKINENLMEMYSTHNDSIKKVLRSELKLALRPMMAAMECKEEKIKAATLMVGSTKAQTDEAEKFFADVLAELEQISIENNKRSADGSSNVASCMEGTTSAQSVMDWFEDPITCKLMCDPVKAVDGHTYDRWTIVQHVAISKSPYSPDQAFAIATDDIDVRSRLFARFPEQEVKFRSERAAYREAALEAANRGYFGDAVSMLGHVLQWDPDDKKCQERRDQALLDMEMGESVLKAGQSLQAGASLCKGSYKLIMQRDDNLVIYCHVENGGKGSPYPTWSSKTYLKAGGKGECYLTMQRDGNLVMYRGGSKNEVVWASNSQAVTSSNSSSSKLGDYALHLKETGILEIRSSNGERHWCSEPMKTLMAGESLKAGSFLLNGAYKLGMQRDDNLVIYHLQDNEWEHAVWASGTMGVAGGKGTCRLVMQHDCNLVVYDGEGTAVWMSNSWNPQHRDYSLHLRSDGCLGIQSPDGHTMWSLGVP